MTMTLEEAMHKIGDLEATNRSLTDERDRLLTHKGELEGDLAKAKASKSEAEAKATDLETKIPKDGSRVLPKEQAKDYDAFVALNLKPDEIKTKLEEAATDRQAVVTAGNKEALATLGLKPSALRLRDFDGAVVTASKDKDGKVTATVKAGETETPWEQFVKDKGLESDLADFKAQPSGVEVLPQHQGGGSGVKTVQQTQEQKQQTGDYSL